MSPATRTRTRTPKELRPPPSLRDGSPPAGAGSRAALNGFAAEAKEVLAFLEAKTGRRFRAVTAKGDPTTSAKFIQARLRDGATVQDCRSVIARKWQAWRGDPKMAPYLRPETLFNATKWESYLSECSPVEVPE